MKTKLILLFLALGLFAQATYAQEETITISGQVTDFEGNPIDSSIVRLIHADFSDAYKTYTDKNGHYTLEVKKGRYAALYALRPKEYPRRNAVPKEDMRLEFWAWNVIADRDLTIDAHYQKLELYGTTVFDEYGGVPHMYVYFRPMSVTRLVGYRDEVIVNKEVAERESDLSVSPEHIGVEVFADGQPLKVLAIQPIEIELDNAPTAYLVQVERPSLRPDKPYIIFRVVVTNREYDEIGENLYFYEVKNYE